MANDTLEQIADLVAFSSIRELTIESDGRRLTIRKGSSPLIGEEPSPTELAPETFAEAAGEAGPQPASKAVTSPMVGIYHPSRPPVTVGTRVERGQVVGLIESMKLMNDVRCEVTGDVREVLVEDGQPVEYGQPLFDVELEQKA